MTITVSVTAMLARSAWNVYDVITLLASGMQEEWISTYLVLRARVLLFAMG